MAELGPNGSDLERVEGWLDHLPDSEVLTADRLIAERLANCVARVPGDRQDKIMFFLAQYTAMADWVESEKNIDPFTQPRRFGAAMRAAAFSWWRRYHQNRERPQMRRT